MHPSIILRILRILHTVGILRIVHTSRTWCILRSKRILELYVFRAFYVLCMHVSVCVLRIVRISRTVHDFMCCVLYVPYVRFHILRTTRIVHAVRILRICVLRIVHTV